MAILKNETRDRFTVISNALLEDSRLAWDARGVLCYLLSKPSGWVVRVAELQNAGNCGRDKIQRIMRELRAAGYVTDDYDRDSVTGKVCGQTIVVHETPVEVSSMSAEQEDNRMTGFPASGKSSSLVSTDLVVNKEKKKEEITASQAMRATRSFKLKNKLSPVAQNMVAGTNEAIRIIKRWQKEGTQCPSLACLVVTTDSGIQYANQVAQSLEDRVLYTDTKAITSEKWTHLILEVYRKRYAKTAEFRKLDDITLSYLMGTALADWQDETFCGYASADTCSVLSLVYDVAEDAIF